MIRQAVLITETVCAIGLIFAFFIIAALLEPAVSLAVTNPGPNSLTRVGAASASWNQDLNQMGTASTKFACVTGLRGSSQSSARLVAAFGFDKIDGRRTPDLSGNRTSAEVVNGALMAGRFRKALALNGTNAYARIEDPRWPPHDFTYAAWVFPLVVNGWRAILEMQTPESRGFELAVASGGYLEIWSYGKLVLRNGIPVRALEWTHVAATRSGSLITVFLNGVAHRAGQGSTVFDFGNCPALIGVDADQGCAKKLNGFFHGAIDELRVYDCALSASDIREIMEQR
jgi:hypothetical protein